MDRRRIVFNKRTVVFLLLFLILLGVAASFGVNYIRRQTVKEERADRAYAVNSAQEFAGSIMDKLGFSDMTLLSAQQSGNYYALPSEILQAAAVYTSHADSALQEIAVFQCADEKEHNLVSRAVDDRVKAFVSAQNSFNNSERLTDDLYFLESNGEFVILVLGTPYEQVSAAMANLVADNTTQGALTDKK